MIPRALFAPPAWTRTLQASLRLALLIASPALLACSLALPKREAHYQDIDRPAALAKGRSPNPFTVRKKSSGEGEGKEGECTQWTGMAEDGSCQRLAVENYAMGERILLPHGAVILGGVPRRYNAEPDSQGRPIIRYPSQPMHREDLASFWIDVVEVQRVAYQACVTAGRCKPARCPSGGEGIPVGFAQEKAQVLDRLPQTCVTFEQARDYCSFRGGSLPTPAQWSYAARGPEPRHYSWGSVQRDEQSVGALPVHLQTDRSYFGVVGLSAGVTEILAGEPEHDAWLSPWLTGPFRSRTGPYLRGFDAWVRRYACPKGPLDARCRQKERKARHFLSGFRIDGLRWGWSGAAQDETLVQGPNLERPMSFPHPDIGFRCVYPRRDEDPDLKLPKNTPETPETLTGEGLSLFTGAAEALTFAEAKAFCANLRLQADKDRPDALAWRLPTRSELTLIQELRLGPGPLWLADGKGVRAKLKVSGEIESFEDLGPAQASTTMIARCVR